MRGLTHQQKTVLSALFDYQRFFGHLPSVRKLEEYLGVSLITAFDYLKALERKGYLQREKCPTCGRSKILQFTEKALDEKRGWKDNEDRTYVRQELA